MASSAIHGLFPRRLPTAPMAVRNAENGGPAGGRTVTVSENPRPSLPGGVTSPCHCRLRFLISCPVRALAGPRKYTFYTAGPRDERHGFHFDSRPCSFLARSSVFCAATHTDFAPLSLAPSPRPHGRPVLPPRRRPYRCRQACQADTSTIRAVSMRLAVAM